MKNNAINMKTSVLRALIMLLGLALMLYGLHRGEATTVMQRAITVCLECIGIG